MNRGGRVEATPPEYALAAEMFDLFCSAGTMKQILALHREICNTLSLKPNRFLEFYPLLKDKLVSSWKAQALFKKFDARANHKVYARGRACAQNKVLIIGAGPSGLRAAIECQLLGAKVVVIEKRDRMSRNNVLHLWPFVIHDLKALGAKKFFGKFCAGSIDHISIRQLQFILLKVALLLGVEFHEGVSFEELLHPTVSPKSGNLGWRARVSPPDHPVSQYEFDALVGADGKRNTLQGFKRTDFRGKLAMAITANFINRHTEQEAAVEEISGVAFIFNQKFFKELYERTKIDLENIVYYKDDTHYFVMTAKKHSLLNKGVLLKDYSDVSQLLHVDNVDRKALMQYAQEAARFATGGELPLHDFALNHYGEPDVALFDFTSMSFAENASVVYERHGRRLLCQLVGDSLLEPFWPTGSGCARGFLSAMDAAWALRSWGQSPPPHSLEVIAERQSIYKLLAQTTPENLHRDIGAYTLDPGTRYPNLNRTAVSPHRVTSYYNSDDPLPLDATLSAKKRRREPVTSSVSDEALVAWAGVNRGGVRAAADATAMATLLRRYRPDLLPPAASPRAVYHVLHQEFGITPFAASGTLRDVPEAKLRSYLARVYNAFKGEVPHIHHQSDMFNEMKQVQLKEKHQRNIRAHSAYSNADTDKSHSSYKKKRRTRSPQVSNDPVDYIRKKIGKLDLNDITQLAKLIEGHDAISNEEKHNDKQLELQEQILALLDPEESPDPKMVRNSLAQLLQGNTKMKLKLKEIKQPANLVNFFQDTKPNERAVKPPRRLKGLDADSIKVPDFSDIFQDDSADTDVTLVDNVVTSLPKKKEFSPIPSVETIKRRELKRSPSIEKPVLQTRRLSEVIASNRQRNSESPEFPLPHVRSNSIGSAEMSHNTRHIVQSFEDHNRRHIPSPESHSVRSGSIGTPEMALRRKIMAEIIEGKRCDTPSPDRTKQRSVSIGNTEMAMRKQRVVDLIQGNKPRQSPEPSSMQRRNSGEMAFRMQRVSDMIEKKNSEAERPKSGGRRKAAREIMRLRFEKSLQMLAAEPRMDFLNTTDLENDYGLQQYRASAPQFDERVKKLEKKLLHYEEGRAVGGGGRTVKRGTRVARLAAVLAGTSGAVPSAPGASAADALPGTSSAAALTPRTSKPKDLMRSVGKIERDDWNVKEIERKITENRLGRPEPKTPEKVPKWDREQFLGRQRKLKEGDGNEEKWGEMDETLQRLNQKLNDSGRPDQGTKKVADLATKFVKKEEPAQTQPKEEFKKSWRGPATTGVQCAACGAPVFAAERVTADGLHLHRACFRCAVCKAVLRPGNFTMERYGSRLVCLRHSGVRPSDTTEGATATALVTSTAIMPERISIELSDGAREIDEDEWTDRNFPTSETSVVGGLSDEEESSSDDYVDAPDTDNEAELSSEPLGIAVPRLIPCRLHFSDDSFGYDDYSDDGAESSGNESCSRMRAAREARRREVPADARPPTDSSEVESEEESESSDEEVSSATEVSTDSEFAREEIAPAPSPPAILVTEATPPAPPPPQDYPLSRTRSAGGLATKRALELKRKYLLGEPSPPAVRKSDSTSQLDTKLEAFRSTITEFQKMLHPAPSPTNNQVHKPIVTFKFSAEERKIQPMPDIIKNLCSVAPVDLLTKVDSSICKKDWEEPTMVEEKEATLESDSLSDEESSHTETGPNKPVPRVEVHDEGGELIQLDSLILINSGTEDNDEKASATATSTGPTVVRAESDSSESCRDATTLALTETELSDWAAESAVLDDCNFDEKVDKGRCKNPRTLKGPKLVHDAKNITAISSHVCGRMSPAEPVLYCNAAEHFEFADEGDQDPSIETPTTPRNEGYMEMVDDEYEPHCHSNDRSMNFIERSFSETVFKPTSIFLDINTGNKSPNDSSDVIEYIDEQNSKTEDESNTNSVNSPQLYITDKEPSEAPKEVNTKSDTVLEPTDEISNSSSSHNNNSKREDVHPVQKILDSVSLSEISPPLETEETDIVKNKSEEGEPKSEVSIDDTSPPLASEIFKSHDNVTCSRKNTFSPPSTIRLYAPAICRSASENFNRSNSRSTNSPTWSIELSLSNNLSPDSMSPVRPSPLRDTTDKVQELKREREEQTEVVRRLVLERLGSGPRISKKSNRRSRLSSVPSSVPPPVPPPPALPAPPSPPAPPPPPPSYYTPPPCPASPLISLPGTPFFSDPELARGRRRKGIMRSISNYFNRRLGPRHKEAQELEERRGEAHKSTGALQQPPPVPPPPAAYYPPLEPPAHIALPASSINRRAGLSGVTGSAVGDAEERDAMQLWFEARWARLVAQRRARDEPRDEPSARRLARLHRRLTRPLSAEQQAAAVAELVQVSAQRDAHQALMAADRRRNGGSIGD